MSSDSLSESAHSTRIASPRGAKNQQHPEGSHRQSPMTNQDAVRQRKRSRCVVLLTKLLAANWLTVNEVAEVLVVDPRTIGRYISGEIEMPVERQVCFARFLVERVPPLARQGRNLLSQIAASIEYANSTTEVHTYAPVARSRTF